MKTLILTLALTGIAIILLGVRVLFVKGGKFPDSHAHNLPGLQKKAHNKKKNN